MKHTRHLYAPPIFSQNDLAIDLARSISGLPTLHTPLRFRPPNLLPVEYDALDLYQLFEDFEYLQMGVDGVYRPRTEKKGRLVDGASVPRPAWSFMPPDGRHRRAAFTHDLDYGLKLLPKRLADLEFRRRLLEDGVSKARVIIAYSMVKAFGNPDKSVARWSEPLYLETP